MKSWYSRANCAGVILPLFSHQMVCSVWSSQTIYLSFGLRPVCTPVSAHNAPPDVTCASPSLRAHSYSSGSRKFQFNPFRSLNPNLSAPNSGLRVPCSNISFLPERRLGHARYVDDDRFTVARRPTWASQCPATAESFGKLRHVMPISGPTQPRQARDQDISV